MLKNRNTPKKPFIGTCELPQLKSFNQIKLNCWLFIEEIIVSNYTSTSLYLMLFYCFYYNVHSNKTLTLQAFTVLKWNHYPQQPDYGVGCKSRYVKTSSNDL